MTITLTKTKLAVAILAVAMLAPATAFAFHVFDDVPDDAFYADPVEWAFDNSITTGKTSTQFAPLDNVTRGESVTFLKRYDDNVVQPAIAANSAALAGKADSAAVYTQAEVDAAVAAAVAAAKPVAEYSGGNSQVSLTTTDAIIESISLTAPSAGTVLADSSAYMWLASGTDAIGRCSLTTGTTTDGAAFQYVEINADATAASDVISGTRGFDVTAGQDLTVNLVCDEFNGELNVSDAWVAAIFVAD